MTALFPKAAGQQRCQISPLPFRRQPSRGPGGADQPAAIFLGGTDPVRQSQRQPVGRNPVACPPAQTRCLGLGQPLHRPRPNHRHTFSQSADIESQVREVGRQRAFDRAPVGASISPRGTACMPPGSRWPSSSSASGRNHRSSGSSSGS